jgi:uncharacterized C2H2 Zn-finger protein
MSQKLTNLVECNICDYKIGSTSRQQHLKGHYIYNHFKCPECQKNFQTKDATLKHVFEMHKFGFKCPDCDYITTRKDSMDTHCVKTHQICFECKKKFPSNSTLAQHMVLSHGRKNMKCDSCDFISTKSVCLTRHTKSIHQNKKQLPSKNIKNSSNSKTGKAGTKDTSKIVETRRISSIDTLEKFDTPKTPLKSVKTPSRAVKTRQSLPEIKCDTTEKTLKPVETYQTVPEINSDGHCNQCGVLCQKCIVNNTNQSKKLVKTYRTLPEPKPGKWIVRLEILTNSTSTQLTRWYV